MIRKFLLFLFVLLTTTEVFAQIPDKEKHNEGRIIDAVAKYDAGDYSGASAVLKEILASDPDNDAAYYYMAMISADKKDFEAAEAYLRMAVELDGNNFWYRYRLAKLYAVTSRPELTIDMYEKLLEDYPKKSELYFDLVELYSAQKEFDKALQTLDEIELVLGVTEAVAMFRFNLYLASGKTEEAFSSLEEYNQKYSSPYVLSTLGDHQMSMYNDSTALAYYNEALELAPDYAPALLGKAETLRITRKYQEFFEVVERFVIDPNTPARGKSDYLMAVVQRTDPIFIKTFIPQIDSVINDCLRVHPKDSSVLNLAGVYYYSTGRNEKAGDYFAKNVEIYPKSYSAAANYVEMLMYSERWEELAEQGRRMYDRFPYETAFLEMASMGDYNLKRYENVLDICETMLLKAPDDSSTVLRTYSTMGDIYYQLGDSKKAFSSYKKALKVNPDYPYVLNNYAYYLSEMGKQLKKAQAMSKKTVDAEPDNPTYLDTYAWILYLQGKPDQAKPFFKHAMLYGGKDSVVILDHYAEVLYALGEYDLAFVYWNMAKQKNDDRIPDLEEKIRLRREAVNKK